MGHGNKKSLVEEFVITTYSKMYGMYTIVSMHITKKQLKHQQYPFYSKGDIFLSNNPFAENSVTVEFKPFPLMIVTNQTAFHLERNLT